MKKEQQVYQTMVSALTKSDWDFDQHPEELAIVSSCQGEDEPIHFMIKIHPENEVILFWAMLDFPIPEQKRVDMAVAVCVANYGMINGSFDFNINDGDLQFRLTTSYCDSQIGEGFFMDMLATALTTTDNYNDKFQAIANGTLSLQEFMRSDKAE